MNNNPLLLSPAEAFRHPVCWLRWLFSDDDPSPTADAPAPTTDAPGETSPETAMTPPRPSQPATPVSGNQKPPRPAAPMTEEQKADQRTRYYLRPIRRMAAYLAATFEFRHNIVRDTYEYRRRDGGDAFLLVDKQQLNTICIDIQDHGGIFCYDRYVEQRIHSSSASDYHPVRAYLDSVRGRWDGQDRTADLLRRVSASDYCLRMGRLWLRATVAQWLGTDTEHANAVMLLLVSERQGLQKSTFLRSILPPQLKDYYTDDFSLSSKGNAQRKLVEYALVNVDEFDKEPRQKMPLLKTLMQTMKPSFIGAYKKNFNQLPRIASFAGTSNCRHVLTDRTGSRRFLILEPDGVIPVDGIDHDQLYAQLVSEVEQGLPYYFSKAEEAELQAVNRQYYVLSELEELLSRFLRPAADGDDDAKELSGNELLRLMSAHNPRLLRTVSLTELGRSLTRLSVPRIHTRDGNAYRVVLL